MTKNQEVDHAWPWDDATEATQFRLNQPSSASASLYTYFC